MSVGIHRRFSGLPEHRVLRHPKKKSAEKPNEVRTLSPELVLRDIPRESIEGSRHPERLGVAAVVAPARAQAPGSEVVRIAAAP